MLDNKLYNITNPLVVTIKRFLIITIYIYKFSVLFNFKFEPLILSTILYEKLQQGNILCLAVL